MALPTMEKLWVRWLDFIDKNPGSTWEEIHNFSHPGSAIYTSKTEFAGLYPSYLTRTKRGRSYAYTINDKGLKIVETARKTAWLFEFCRIAKDNKSQSLEELDVQLTLCGMHKYLEMEFLKKFATLLEMSLTGSDRDVDGLMRYFKRQIPYAMSIMLYAKSEVERAEHLAKVAVA